MHVYKKHTVFKSDNNKENLLQHVIITVLE